MLNLSPGVVISEMQDNSIVDLSIHQRIDNSTG